MGLPSHSYGTSLAIRDHTVLPATRHKWTRPTLTPASKLVLDLPTPEGWKAEDLGYPAMHRPGFELVTFRRPNHYTTEASVHTAHSAMINCTEFGHIVVPTAQSLNPVEHALEATGREKADCLPKCALNMDLLGHHQWLRNLIFCFIFPKSSYLNIITC